jgi:hypothetical protein
MFSHFLLDTENKFANLENPTFHLALIRFQRIFAEQEVLPKNTNIQGEINKIEENTKNVYPESKILSLTKLNF